MVPGAVFNLGELLEQQGDVEGAKVAYQQALASEHAKVAPWAAFNLGGLLAEQGAVEGAQAAYQRAIKSGHPDWASRAAHSLERLRTNTPPPAVS